MKKINIAIDGFSSTGKSTLAKELAKKLGYVYVDSGAMYRAVTLFALNNGFISEDKFLKSELISSLSDIDLSFEYNPSLGYSEILLNGVNVEEQIRSLYVSNFVSRIAEISEVREKLVEQQQIIGANKGVVMDGRDIGTVVFPNAELKIFMSASSKIRAERRFKEMKEKNQNVSFEEILKNVENRDEIDTTRNDSPLVQSVDAILIDNSNMSKEEQFEKVLSLVKNVIN